MADPKDPKDLNAPKDPKDLNKPAPPDNEARPEKAELTDEDLEKLSGGAFMSRTFYFLVAFAPAPGANPGADGLSGQSTANSAEGTAGSRPTRARTASVARACKGIPSSTSPAGPRVLPIRRGPPARTVSSGTDARTLFPVGGGPPIADPKDPKDLNQQAPPPTTRRLLRRPSSLMRTSRSSAAGSTAVMDVLQM